MWWPTAVHRTVQRCTLKSSGGQRSPPPIPKENLK
nr:MAG TPA: hypothetical protein [Caudoviricetes sp.]